MDKLQQQQQIQNKDNLEQGIFCGGCFWGIEYIFQKVPGVKQTAVGFIGGSTEEPSYKDVCYKDTNHAEGVLVKFNPSETSYENLVITFFEIHDPTQLNKQGPDEGSQYRSEIFYFEIEYLKNKGLNVVTQVTDGSQFKFWKAEDYHQSYFQKNGGEQNCHRRVKRFG